MIDELDAVAMTPRQAAVLELHQAGKNPTEIGKELGISSQGVHGHLRRLRDRGVIEPAPRRRSHANGVGVTDAFGHVRASIERQKRELQAHIKHLDRDIAVHYDAIEKLRADQATTTEAVERLTQLEEQFSSAT